MKIAVVVLLVLITAAYMFRRRRTREIRPGAAGRSVIAANLAASRRRL